MNLNDSTSPPQDTSLLTGKHIAPTPLSDLFMGTPVNNGIADFSPPLPKKNEEAPKGTVPSAFQIDTMAQYGQATEALLSMWLPVIEQESKARAEESVQDEVDDFDARLNTVRSLMKDKKFISLYESLYVDTKVSLKDMNTDKGSTNDPTDPPPPQETQNWAQAAWTYVINLYHNLFGSKPVEKTSEADNIDNVGAPKPIHYRPMLQEPGLVKKEHFDKLVREAKEIMDQMRNNLNEFEEILKKLPVDVSLMQIVKMTSLKQSDESKQNMLEQTEAQFDLVQKNRNLIEILNRFNQDLTKSQKLSKNLGWVNAGLTVIALASTVWLFFATGGTGVIPVIASAASGLNGAGIIAKGMIDHDADKYKGELSYLSTQRQINSQAMEKIATDMHKTISQMYRDIENIMRLLIMIRDTIQYSNSLQ